LGALLALRFATAAGVNAYIVDPVTVDEWQECARITGSPLVERLCAGHVLNTKAVARRFAREQKRSYEALRLVVVHMGSGITVSAHRGGRMIDNNTIGEGPFGPDRSGWLPARELVKVCFSGRYTQNELERQVFGDGGLLAYLGTRDLRDVESRIDAGDAQAARVLEAMIYQIGKEAGAMAVVLEGKVDSVLLTRARRRGAGKAVGGAGGHGGVNCTDRVLACSMHCLSSCSIDSWNTLPSVLFCSECPSTGASEN
jgi:butyrate kinase